jgi:hypothetical protein
MRVYIYGFSFIASTILMVVYLGWVKPSEYDREIFFLASTGLSASIGALVGFILENWNSFWLSVRCLLYHRNEMIYVSLSYLFCIKVKGENKYLTVRGSKIKHQYQPVGGVYKKYPSLDEKWRKWQASSAKNDRINSDDLRFFVKCKFIPSVRKWFHQGKNREIDVWREFYEELLAPEILPKDSFNHIKPEFLYRKEEQLITRKGVPGLQFLIYDVYKVNLSPEQEQILMDLYDKSPFTSAFAFVDEDDLDKEIFKVNDEEQLLGYHARYLKSESC